MVSRAFLRTGKEDLRQRGRQRRSRMVSTRFKGRRVDRNGTAHLRRPYNLGSAHTSTEIIYPAKILRWYKRHEFHQLRLARSVRLSINTG
jgi:hypothetical protein